MRLCSGIYRGMPIVTPRGLETRPTGEKARQAVFNMLQMEVAQASFLDLFAGSGAMGLEALSRGAKKSVFVENDRKTASILQENIDELLRRATASKVPQPEAVFLCLDVGRAFKPLSKHGPYHIIWADPPYADGPKWWAILAKELAAISQSGTIFAAESDVAGQNALLEEFAKIPDWRMEKDKAYGSSRITIYRKE